MRLALKLQQALGRAAGTGLSVGFAVYLMARQSYSLSHLWDLVVMVLFASSLLARIVQRFRLSPTESTSRLDFELYSHVACAVYAGLVMTANSLTSPYQALMYVVLIAAAALTKPIVSLAVTAYAIAVELGLLLGAPTSMRVGVWLPHSLVAILVCGLTLLVFRAEMARVRRVSREHIDSEIDRMKDAARSYRLLVAPSGVSDARTTQRNGDERAMHSAVEEIRATLSFNLDLLRRSLDLRVVGLFWLEAAGQRLILQELVGDSDGIAPGPLTARDGILGAALSQLKPVSLSGSRLGRQLPYRGDAELSASVCAVPVMDGVHARGILLVERAEKRAFLPAEIELLSATTRFILRTVENERVFVQLERAKLEQGKLYRTVDRLAASSTEADVIEAAVNSAREFASFDCAVVTLFDRSHSRHEICAASGEGTESLVGRSFDNNSSLVAMAVSNRHALPYRGDFDPIRQTLFAKGVEFPVLPSVLVLPLLVHERALGTLVLGCRRKGAFTGEVRTILEVLGSHLAVSLSNARMVRRLEELATLDGLTGLLNKRTLLEVAHQKLRAATRFGKSLSVLICDIDHFKKVNDSHGHDVGDIVIRGFAEVLKRMKRDVDVLGRFGGEEFVIVCEETAENGAMLLAERIRTELEATRFSTPQDEVRVTCSIGIATYPTTGHEWDTLFKVADDALYVSKRNGRNRVTQGSPKRSHGSVVPPLAHTA
ncbi:MAG TPA: GGDEF domain-containing protein [Polyangiaceae bacterium]